MHPFESLTAEQVAALSPAERSAYEAWFWRWLCRCCTVETDTITDIETERREGWGYDRS